MDTAPLNELVRMLLEERGETMPVDLDDTTLAESFRALCNLRSPKPAPPGFFELQDAYLKETNLARGVVRVDQLEYQDGVALWKGDITRLDADAIVNAGNAALLGCFEPLHHCVDNVIHSCAGVQLRLACHAHMAGRRLPAGEVVRTPAFNLPSRHVLHTVGPIVRDGRPSARDAQVLQGCYRNSLVAASESGFQTVAFCSIATGLYGYPQAEASVLAVETVRDWLARHDGPNVIFDVYSREDMEHYERALRR